MKRSLLALKIAFAVGLSCSAALRADETRIYLANDDHTDYMWTADADTYNAVFVDMLDYYLRLADETTGNPSPYQSRFNADGSYWLWNYERQKSPAEFERLMKRVRDGPVSRAARAAWQDLLAGQIEYYVNPLHADSAARLGYLIQKPAADSRRFYVLNCLGSARTESADFAYTGSANIHVRDATTGKEVPHQIVTLEGISCLRILASDVPQAGYKTYEILSGPGAAPQNPAATVSADYRTIENSFIKLFSSRMGPSPV